MTSGTAVLSVAVFSPCGQYLYFSEKPFHVLQKLNSCSLFIFSFEKCLQQYSVCFQRAFFFFPPSLLPREVENNYFLSFIYHQLGNRGLLIL